MSERLTTRLANGGVGYDNGEYFKVCYPWNEHCLTDIDRMAIKLCDLEDKIEQGKILELPCAVGQTVYRMNIFNSAYREATVVAIYYTEDKKYYPKPHILVQHPDTRGRIRIDFREIGKTVFLDRASAEAKVRKMEGDNNG